MDTYTVMQSHTSIGLLCHSYHEEVLILLYEMVAPSCRNLILFLSPQVYKNTEKLWAKHHLLEQIHILEGNQSSFYNQALDLANKLEVGTLIGTEAPTICDFDYSRYTGSLNWVLHELKVDFNLDWVPPWRGRKTRRRKKWTTYVQAADGYYVLSPEMLVFAKTHTSKPVVVIPIRQVDQVFNEKNHDHALTIVISGRVNECKDYTRSIQLIYALNESGHKINLIMLGRLDTTIYGSKIKHLADQANLRHPKIITYFDHYIEDETFGEIISRCDCLLAPLNRNNSFLNKCFSRKNLIDYHISNHITGSYEEAVRYGKPIIYLNGFMIHTQLLKGLLYTKVLLS
ncbi:glycosyltransferase [Rubritalea profundi]|uniref:Uncharacterized protein n=1 Tax=Rubritalea profundi TaxID=1658618 RepID=A0A2S7TZB4_9BACT|nr:glycosyltransferase [Rubritalea profundi]PQJ28086.1 hypothetical protein BSZ32_05920 [Rubritalea profundi]